MSKHGFEGNGSNSLVLYDIKNNSSAARGVQTAQVLFFFHLKKIFFQYIFLCKTFLLVFSDSQYDFYTKSQI